MRPLGELEEMRSTQYASTSWVPDYSYFTAPDKNWGLMYTEYLKCARQLLQAETDYGDYKDMKYEDAHDQMQTFRKKSI